MYERPFVGTPLDYSDKNSWLALPEVTEKAVDVIYLYPSSCMDPEAGVIAPADEPTLVAGAKNNFEQQATAFEEAANIYAPWWRQVNGALLAGMTFEEVDNAEWAEPRTDVFAALDYYFENLNDGRPFFLAGHSQGSRLCYMVIAEYMKVHPEYYERMIAAYCIGDSLTKGYLKANPHVKAAQAEDDLGVIVSWNTEGPGNKGAKSLVVAPEAVAINPLNWSIDETPASSNLNLGTYIPHMLDGGMDLLSEKADAVLDVERGSIMVTNPELKKYVITAIPGFEMFDVVFGPESFHMCDYSFFYNNIQKNALVRAEAWMKQK